MQAIMEGNEAKTENKFKVPQLISKVNNDIPPLKFVAATADKPTKPTAKDAKVSDQNVVLPYTEPVWAGIPTESYSFEVIKSGVIISNFTIWKSCTVVGRLTTCDIALEHPSVSRYHAILQYCIGTDVYPKGLYVYDLGSTHCTFLNKEKIQANTYYLVKFGHVLKFGGSTRLHILHCPESDGEVIKEVLPEAVPITTKSEEICSWGIGEDAEEEDDLSINPFAVSTENEELFIDDPKKTLKGWFEREGYELEYNVEEKGLRTFACSVQLPIDTPTGDFLRVEASVNGKKKEAVVACALEACRTLDRHGLLRQSQQSSRERKRKNWEDADFYDSDEDTYLDRTGTIEKKRQIRMQHTVKSEPETFSSLEKKLREINEEISDIEKNLAANVPSQTSSSSLDEEDPLDSFMSRISEPIDKVTRSKLKLDLAERLKERSKLQKMLNIAKPTELPIKKFPTMIGKRIKSKLKLPVAKPVIKEVLKSDDGEVEEEEDDDKPVKNNLDIKEELPSELENKSDVIQSLLPAKKEMKDHLEMDPLEINKSHVPIARPGPCEKDSTKQSSPGNVSMGNVATKKPRSARTGKKDIYKTANENYSMWMPPDNQKGDGTTHLNTKYGY